MRIVRPSSFQFQNGAIISIKWCNGKYIFCEFQFQNGAIISLNDERTPITKILFQFQNGAIIRPIHNNSITRIHNVSIPKWCDYKRSEQVKESDKLPVSIPKWCDYKHKLEVHKTNPKQVSIPKWCDYKIP